MQAPFINICVRMGPSKQLTEFECSKSVSEISSLLDRYCFGACVSGLYTLVPVEGTLKVSGYKDIFDY